MADTDRVLRPVALALAVALLAGCTASGSGQMTVRPAMSSADASALVQSRMGGHLVSLGADFVPSVGNENLPTILAEVPYDRSVPGEQSLATWYAEVAASAVGTLMAGGRNPADVVDGISVVHRRADGRSRIVSGGSLHGGLEIDPTHLDDEAITQDVVEIVEGFGLADVRVEVLRPLDAAVVVTAMLPDGLEIDWTLDEVFDAVRGEPARFEGLYLQVVDTHGVPMGAVFDVMRHSLGGVWWRPGTDVVLGIEHGEPAF